MIHALKIFPEYFSKVISGEKTFEIRKNDRDFRVGDYIALNEFTRESGYTGRSALYYVAYVTKDFPPPIALPDGYVILGICPCGFHRDLDIADPTVTRSFEERGRHKKIFEEVSI